jgi:hypothetical protein
MIFHASYTFTDICITFLEDTDAQQTAFMLQKAAICCILKHNDDIREGKKKLHSKERFGLLISPNIIRVSK